MQNPAYPNAWDQTKETSTNASVAEDARAIESDANYVGEKINETSENVKDKTGEAIDTLKAAANASVNEGVSAIKHGATNAWDQTKDTAGHMTHSAIHMGGDMLDMGSDIIGACKSGVEAGWNKARGTDGD